MKPTQTDLEITKHIISTVSDVTGVSRSKIRSKDRHNEIAMARFMVYYILYYHIKYSFSYIGKLLKRHHATIMYGVGIADTWSESNKFRDKIAIEYCKKLQQVIDKLYEKSNS